MKNDMGSNMADKQRPSTPKALNNQVGKNSELGLPFGRMQKITIAFDVDGTIRDNTVTDKIVGNENIRHLLYILSTFKNVKIVVWSGSGGLYASQVCGSLGLTSYINQFASKTEHKEINPDIAIDDIQDTAIGKINLIVREK